MPLTCFRRQNFSCASQRLHLGGLRLLAYIKQAQEEGSSIDDMVISISKPTLMLDMQVPREIVNLILDFAHVLEGNLVIWRSHKQKVVACSSTESENRAMAKIAWEMVSLQSFLKDLGISFPSPMPMHCHN